MPDVIVLNGGSSSGKTSIARCLQGILPGLWLTFGADTLVEALPPSDPEFSFTAGGEVVVGPEFRRLDMAWSQAIATMVRAGTRIIVDEVFLGGPASQKRWREALEGVPVLWVGVRCDASVATARESSRGDRPPGMAASQATLVHEGVTYDLEVDTSVTDTRKCAQIIASKASD